MKKASTLILGGLAGAVGVSAQAGDPIEIFEEEEYLCQGEETWEFGSYGCTYEVSVRCDGLDADYGRICLDPIVGLAVGDYIGVYALATHTDQDGNCDTYGVYGATLDPFGAMFAVTDELEKAEAKITDAPEGNGKKGHPGNKGSGDETTVEIEIKRGECIEL